MRTWLVIYLKELRSFFFSPLAFIVAGMFAFLNGWLFVAMVKLMRLKTLNHSLVYNLFTSGWFWMGFFILFPLITMRLFSEEKKMGTFEGLMTAPVRTAEVLLGKYFAAFTVYLAMMAPLFFFFPVFKLITRQESAFHNGAIWGAMLALLLVGAFYVAIGTLASALTSNQLIAAMLTFVGGMLHYFFGFLGGFASLPNSQWASAMDYFSTIQHIQRMSDGLIDSRVFVYYLSFSLLLLVITYHIIESRRWKIQDV